jgi:T5SS/PEP-CTERM-associated repeat protein
MGATCYWTVADGAFEDPSSWDPSGTPTVADGCVFTNPNAYRITATQDHATAYLDFQRGEVTFDLDGHVIDQAMAEGIRIGTWEAEAASLLLENGRLMTSNTLVATESDSWGRLRVTGSGASFSHRMKFYLGYQGTGILEIGNGGCVSMRNNWWTYLASSNRSRAEAAVEGPGAVWRVSSMVVGRYGAARGDVRNSGQILCESGWQYFPYFASGNAEVAISDSGSAWSNTSSSAEFFIGYYGGSGFVTVTNGASLFSGRRMDVGYCVSDAYSSTGRLDVMGTGSCCQVRQQLTVGHGVSGKCSITDRARFADVTFLNISAGHRRSQTDVGNQPGRSGGAGSLLQCPGNLIVGIHGGRGRMEAR